MIYGIFVDVKGDVSYKPLQNCDIVICNIFVDVKGNVSCKPLKIGIL